MHFSTLLSIILSFIHVPYLSLPIFSSFLVFYSIFHLIFLFFDATLLCKFDATLLYKFDAILLCKFDAYLLDISIKTLNSNLHTPSNIQPKFLPSFAMVHTIFSNTCLRGKD
jgi:hypothetical protein